jgi:hypothetical protein
MSSATALLLAAAAMAGASFGGSRRRCSHAHPPRVHADTDKKRARKAQKLARKGNRSK